jgi:protein-disulfide isomerase
MELVPTLATRFNRKDTLLQTKNALSSITRVLEVSSYVALIVAATFVIMRVGSSPSASETKARVIDLDGDKTIEADQLTHVRGSGRLAIVEFIDYQCPFCGTHARTVVPALWRETVDRGQAKYAVLHFPLERIHQLAIPAAVTAECAAEQGLFWEMHERLFQSPLDKTEFNALVRDVVGLDHDRLTRCLAQPDARTRVDRDLALGRLVGVQATPTIFLGVVDDDGGIALKRQVVGSMSADEIKEALANL